MQNHFTIVSHYKEHQLFVPLEPLSNDTFFTNLELIDSRMPKLMQFAEAIVLEQGVTKLSDIAELIAQEHPWHETWKSVYSYKFRQLIIALTYGMLPTVLWDGKESKPIFPLSILEVNEALRVLYENAELRVE
ncbi:MAG: HpaII family restriction endonuclease [Clostridia bacterium]|nr:HpaII family restriction endonuclease [Clostridia bacterium]